MALGDLVEQIEEARELLLDRALALVLLVDERLQQRREVGVKVARLGGAEVGVQELDRKSTRLNSSHSGESRMPSSA